MTFKQYKNKETREKVEARFIYLKGKQWLMDKKDATCLFTTMNLKDIDKFNQQYEPVDVNT